MRTRTKITLIFDNFSQSLIVCQIITSKFHSVFADCRRLRKIVNDSAHIFHKLLKIVCPIVKDCVRLVLVLTTRSLRLILHKQITVVIIIYHS